VVLLRGINVGGRHIVPMADLRDLAASIGLGDPITYIQSGNLVVNSVLDEAALVATLEPALETRYGFPVPVVVRSAAELAMVAEGHPLAGTDSDPRLLMVAFLDRPPTVDVGRVLDPIDYLPDRLLLDGREVYLEYPNGSGRSKLSHSLLEQRLGVSVTIRNWNTITKLVELTDR
jgi:uncharacterized protein (DUF1697 family)